MILEDSLEWNGLEKKTFCACECKLGHDPPLGIRTKIWSPACYISSTVCKFLLASIAFLIPRHHLPQEFLIFLSFINTISPHKSPYNAFVFPPTSPLLLFHFSVLGALCVRTWPWLGLYMSILLPSLTICCLWMIREQIWIKIIFSWHIQND